MAVIDPTKRTFLTAMGGSIVGGAVAGPPGLLGGAVVGGIADQLRRDT